MESEKLEKIGGVTLNYAYYPGEDQYSDGDVEEELLRIARDCPEEDYNRVIAQEKSWPVLYHFSQLRPNIVSWLPIGKGHKVLEIGSGCGALTGTLAGMAGSVTCVELSKRRSLINAYRNRKWDNVEIWVGNFQDIEEKLGAYDFITLIGVFEYAQGYMGGEDPYAGMLRKMACHLSAGGQIVLAIENRIGLKYWSGFTEDHVGTYFEGLEGYPHTSHVRTFSRPGLCKVIERGGDFQAEFHYPFPDYKLPKVVYSDACLPKPGEIEENFPNYDRERILAFSEGRVLDTLIQDGLLPQFSNSFLVTLTARGAQAAQGKRVVFSKFSNDRAEDYSIRTDIWQDGDGKRTVVKTAMHPKAQSHLDNLCRWQDSLNELYQGCGLVMAQGRRLENGGFELEYVQGKTLEEELDRLLDSGQEEAAVCELKAFVENVRRPAREPFAMTGQFRQVFGEVSLPEGMKSLPVTDVDLICGNVILGGSTEAQGADGGAGAAGKEAAGKEAAPGGIMTAIDYEWCFDFPIPVSYLVYRILHYYLYTKSSRDCLKRYGLLSWAGITPEEAAVYEGMEKSFQRYINGSHIPLHEVFGEFGAGKLRLNQMLERERRHIINQTLQVFYERGEGFRPEDFIRLPMKEGAVEAEIDISPEVKGLRLDPGLDPGICCLEKFHFVCGGRELPAKFLSNGCRLEPDVIYFLREDPQIWVNEFEETASKLRVSLKIYHADPFVMDKFLQKEREKAAVREKYQGRIKKMESTKAWKAYRKYRKLVERKL